MIQTTLTLAFLASSVSAFGPPAAVDDLFPPVAGSISVVAAGGGAEGTTMLGLVNAYGDATGQGIILSSETRSVLESQRVPVDRSVELAGPEAQFIFETLLRQADFTIAIAGTKETPMVRVDSLMGSGRSILRSRAIDIEEAEAETVAARHPAVLFSTVVTLPNLDVRQVSNSMRTMIVDANTQQMLPAGNSNSMVLVGFGDTVSAMVRSLKTIDEAARVDSEARRIDVQVVRLEHADAVGMARITRIVYGVSEEQPTPFSTALAIASDPRTNSLIVRGAADQVQRVLELVQALDVEAPGQGKSGKSK